MKSVGPCARALLLLPPVPNAMLNKPTRLSTCALPSTYVVLDDVVVVDVVDVAVVVVVVVEEEDVVVVMVVVVVRRRRRRRLASASCARRTMARSASVKIAVIFITAVRRGEVTSRVKTSSGMKGGGEGRRVSV